MRRRKKVNILFVPKKLNCKLGVKGGFGKRPEFFWIFFYTLPLKNPSHAIFSKSRDFNNIKYNT